MKQIMFISILVLTASSEAFACFRDARICRDGTSRGRDPQRNCEFWPPCPEDYGRRTDYRGGDEAAQLFERAADLQQDSVEQ